MNWAETSRNDCQRNLKISFLFRIFMISNFISCRYITFPVFSFPFIPWFLTFFHEMTSQDFIENHVVKFSLILMHFLSFHCFSLVSLNFRIFWFSNFISCCYISFPVFPFHFILWFQDFISLNEIHSFIHEGKYNLMISIRINSACLGPFHCKGQLRSSLSL